MTTSQIAILSILGIIAIIAFIGAMLNNKYETRILFIIALFSSFGFLFIVALVATQEMNKYSNLAKGKCPEYERIDNVYKLK
jgi:hypothetical protein